MYSHLPVVTRDEDIMDFTSGGHDFSLPLSSRYSIGVMPGKAPSNVLYAKDSEEEYALPASFSWFHSYLFYKNKPEMNVLNAMAQDIGLLADKGLAAALREAAREITGDISALSDKTSGPAYAVFPLIAQITDVFSGISNALTAGRRAKGYGALYEHKLVNMMAWEFLDLSYYYTLKSIKPEIEDIPGQHTADPMVPIYYLCNDASDRREKYLGQLIGNAAQDGILLNREFMNNIVPGVAGIMDYLNPFRTQDMHTL